LNGFKSSISREKLDHFNIDIAVEQPTSELRTKERKKMKKQKSKKQVNLI
jgi:hypothetical protein